MLLRILVRFSFVAFLFYAFVPSLFWSQAFYLCFLLLLLLLRGAYFCLSGVSSISVRACKLWKAAGRSRRDVVQIACFYCFYWADSLSCGGQSKKSNNSTTSHQATRLMAASRARRRRRRSPWDAQPCDPRLKTFFFLNLYFFIADLMYFFYWCICVCCSVFLLVVSDLAGALMMFHWSLWWFLHFILFF